MRLVPIARVGGPHGVKGLLRVSPLASDLEILQNTTEIYVGSSEEAANKCELDVVGTGPRGIRIKLCGVNSREAAAELSGYFIFVPEKTLPPIEEENTYYTFQLIGLSVEDENGRVIGQLTNIMPTGSNDVFIIQDNSGNEYYLPALRPAISKIDINNGLVTVDSSWLT